MAGVVSRLTNALFDPTTERIPMRFYVYALIDPMNDNKPFYIGKGNYGRTEAHFKQTKKMAEEARLVGDCTKSMMEQDAEKEKIPAKTQKILELHDNNFGHQHIARIVARELDEQSSLAIESFLIQYVYGHSSGELLNIQPGHHAERFRQCNKWSINPEFDPATENGLPGVRSKFEARPNYVYVLRNPDSGKVFYVGKGTGSRLAQHFSDAINNVDDGERELLNEIRALLSAGHQPNQIGRIVAYLESESLAFDIEAVLIGFVYGWVNLANIRVGHRWKNIRPHGTWEAIDGFDLPRVVNPDVPQDRGWLRDMLISDGLGQPLEVVKATFPNIKFGDLTVLDAGELGIEGDVSGPAGEVGTRIKIFTRRKNIQLELRSRTKAQKDWIVSHAVRLGFVIREDFVFLPAVWKGVKGMTTDADVACERLRLMLELVCASDRGQLSADALRLLSELPPLIAQIPDALATAEISISSEVDNSIIDDAVEMSATSEPPPPGAESCPDCVR